MPDSEFVERYAIEEMKVARDRINADIDVMNRYEVLSVGLVGAIFALIFQYKIRNREALIFITMLPALVGLYGYFRFRAHAKLVQKYNEYLMAIEAQLMRKDRSFIGLATSQKRSKIKSHIRLVRSLFWIAIIVFSLLLTAGTQWKPNWLANSVTTNTPGS